MQIYEARITFSEVNDSCNVYTIYHTQPITPTVFIHKAVKSQVRVSVLIV